MDCRNETRNHLVPGTIYITPQTSTKIYIISPGISLTKPPTSCYKLDVGFTPTAKSLGPSALVIYLAESLRSRSVFKLYFYLGCQKFFCAGCDNNRNLTSYDGNDNAK